MQVDLYNGCKIVAEVVSFRRHLSSRAANIRGHSDPVYPVKVTVTRNIHYHYQSFPDNVTAVKFLRLNASVVIC